MQITDEVTAEGKAKNADFEPKPRQPKRFRSIL
jgi:hypothetical protein